MTASTSHRHATDPSERLASAAHRRSRCPRGFVSGLLATLVLSSACLRDLDTLEPTPFPAEPEIFHDAFGPSGGVFFATMPRDLTGFNALTFWAKSSTAATMNTVGTGKAAITANPERSR